MRMMMTALLLLAGGSAAMAGVRGAEGREGGDGKPTGEFPLWAHGAPGARGTDPVKDVPTLTPFWPAPGKANGAAMVICPGGGYEMLAPYEGKDYALFLAEHGVAGFVLKYRLGSSGYHHPAMMLDVQRAIRTVRARATAWGLDDRRVGVMGSSAGGHLASVAATHFDAGDPASADLIDRVSSRPDLAVLCYPVISMEEPNKHGGSAKNLLGEHPDPALARFLSSELQVTLQTPPCFLFHTYEDQVVKLQGVLDFAAALNKNRVPFDLHVYEKGGHGMGLGVRGYDPAKQEALHPWAGDLLFWLKGRGW